MLIRVVLVLSVGGCARHAPSAHAAPAAPASPAAQHAVASGCLPTHDGYLRVRMRGAQNLDIDWHDADLQCDGGPRPDQGGLRLTFAARDPAGGRHPRLVFGIAATPAPGSSHAVPANVTLIFEGEQQLYSTRGDDKCTVDELLQTPIDAHRTGQGLRVSGRGFCVAPATALDGSGDVLVSRFDFAGRVVDADPPDHPQ
jgi:hypothetical protein